MVAGGYSPNSQKPTLSKGFRLTGPHRTLDDLRAFLKAEEQTWDEQDLPFGTQLIGPSRFRGIEGCCCRLVVILGGVLGLGNYSGW